MEIVKKFRESRENVARKFQKKLTNSRDDNNFGKILLEFQLNFQQFRMYYFREKVEKM